MWPRAKSYDRVVIRSDAIHIKLNYFCRIEGIRRINRDSASCRVYVQGQV